MFKIIVYLLLGIIKSDFICTNGKNPNVLTTKEYLIEFSKGPCAPLIIIPPLTGSKLVVKIDCQQLREKSPEVFKTCQWTDCEKQPYEFWKKVPQQEYYVWIGNTSPVAFISLDKNVSLCYSRFFAIHFDQIKQRNTMEKYGYEVKILGETKNTKTLGGCGNDTCMNFLPFPYQIKKTQLLSYWWSQCENMGYKRGLTFQILPYDWRKSMIYNELNETFENNLKRIYNITKKKVVFAAHSYGTINLYYQIMKIKQEDKDQMIQTAILVGSQLLGTILGDGAVLMPTKEYSFQSLGFHYQGFLYGFSHNVGAFENSIRDVSQFKDQEWYQLVQKRKNYEDGKVDKDESGYDFLPKKDDLCSPDNFDMKPQCLLGLLDDDDVQIKIGNKKYFKSNIEEVYKDQSLWEETYFLRKYFENKETYELKNPGVSMIFVNSRVNKTPVKLEWEEDLKPHYENNDYYLPQISYGYGDQMVPANTLYLPALKWSYEFKNKKNYKNAKPVKIIDYCSRYNQKENIYDEKINDQYEITKNEFIGINCECFSEKNAINCDHANLMADKHVLNLGKNTLITNQISYSQDFEKYINDLDLVYLEDMQREDCPQIYTRRDEDQLF